MSSALSATPPQNQVIGETGWTPDQVKLIKNTVARHTSDDEFKLFLYTAAKHGLNPLLKEIWCIKNPNRPNDPPVIMTSHQGYINAARRNYPDQYKTTRSFSVHANDEFEFNAMTGEVLKHVIKADRGPIVGAWAVAENIRGERISVYMTFQEMREACQHNPLWRVRPTQMMLKTVEVHVLRRMFPITGLYTHEEMDGDYRPPVVDVTPTSVPEMSPASDEERAIEEPVQEPVQQSADAPSPEEINDLRSFLTAKNIDVSKIVDWAAERLGRLVDKFDDLTKKEFDQLVTAVKTTIERREARAQGKRQGQSND